MSLVEELSSYAKEVADMAEEYCAIISRKYFDMGIGETPCTGCSLGHCCKQPVLATYIEAAPIALLLSSVNTKKLRGGYRKAGEEMELRLLAGEEKRESPVPCVFLQSNNRCAVYPARPVVCRSYFVFKGRDACTPYCERSDGERPRIMALDHARAMGVALMASIEVAQDAGIQEMLPWMRALPLQVANMLEVLENERNGWEYIKKHCVMPPWRFELMAENEKQDEKDGNWVRQELEYHGE